MDKIVLGGVRLKHQAGQHDQSSHGNWADGAGGESEQIAALRDRAKQALGDDYHNNTYKIELDSSYQGNEQGSYSFHQNTVKLNPQASTQLRRYMNGKIDSDSADGLLVYLHELYHAQSPAAGYDAPDFEEGLVELKARKKAAEILPPGVEPKIKYYQNAVKSLQWLADFAGSSVIDRMWKAKTGGARIKVVRPIMRSWIEKMLISKGADPTLAEYVAKRVKKPEAVLKRNDIGMFEKVPQLYSILRALSVIQEYNVPIDWRNYKERRPAWRLKHQAGQHDQSSHGNWAEGSKTELPSPETTIAYHRTSESAANSIKRGGFSLEYFGKGGALGVMEEPAGIFVSPEGTEGDFAREVTERELGFNRILKLRIPNNVVWRPDKKELRAAFDKTRFDFIRKKYGVSQEHAELIDRGNWRKLKAIDSKLVDYWNDYISTQTEIEMKKSFAALLQSRGDSAVEWIEPLYHIPQMVILDPAKIEIIGEKEFTWPRWRLKHQAGQHDQSSHGNWAERNQFYKNEDNRKAIQALVNENHEGKSQISDQTWRNIYQASLDLPTKHKEIQKSVLVNPEHEIGDEVAFLGSSFSGADFAGGETVSTLRTDYSDAIYIVKNPTHGLDVDYGKMKFQGIAGLGGEFETLITGQYRVSRIKKSTNPLGRQQDLIIYFLEEVPASLDEVLEYYRRTEKEILRPRWRLKHQAGQHDQSSHGNWADGNRDPLKSPDRDYTDVQSAADALGMGEDVLVRERYLSRLESAWTQGADPDAKFGIQEFFRGDKEVGRLRLFILYNTIAEEGQDFETWLKTPASFWRGGRPTYGETFATFTPNRATAERYAEQRLGLYEVRIPPKWLIGYAPTGVGEAFVPGDFSDYGGQVVRLKHYAGQHDQERHGWRYGSGSLSQSRRIRRQGEAAWREYKRRARGGAKAGSPKERLTAEIKKAHPDTSDQDIDSYIGVMNLDRKRFIHYARKLGLSDPRGMADEYFRHQQEVERAEARRQWNEKIRNSYESSTAHSEFAINDPNSPQGQRLTRLVGRNWEEAREALHTDDYKAAIFVDDDYAGKETLHEELSMMKNILDTFPLVREVYNKKCQRVHFRNHKRGETFAGRWERDRMIMPASIRVRSTFIHELGHAAQESIDRGDILDVFGQIGSRTASLYGANNGYEDFAEWFTVMILGGDLAGLRRWDPVKFDYIVDNVPGMKEFVQEKL